MSTETMRAAVVRELGKPLLLEEIPVPQPGPRQVLVRLYASGVCHTDLHAVRGDWPIKPTTPFIPGHEGVGKVVALGAEVRNLQVGDRVGIPWLHTACGYCEHCRTGWETLCGSQKNTGYSVNGSFSTHALADPDYVGRIPDRLDWAAAAPILCAGVTVYKGLKEAEVAPGQWVAVCGIGGLGHMAIQYARAMGMRVIAVTGSPGKIEQAKRLGAELVINTREGDPGAQIQKLVGGVHGVLVTAVSPTVFEQAFDMLRPHGTMSLVGLPPDRFAMPIFDTVLKRITVRGSIVGTRQDLEEALEMAANGIVAPEYTSDKLENINDILDRLEKGEISGRVVLDLE